MTTDHGHTHDGHASTYTRESTVHVHEPGSSACHSCQTNRRMSDVYVDNARSQLGTAQKKVEEALRLARTVQDRPARVAIDVVKVEPNHEYQRTIDSLNTRNRRLEGELRRATTNVGSLQARIQLLQDELDALKNQPLPELDSTVLNHQTSFLVDHADPTPPDNSAEIDRLNVLKLQLEMELNAARDQVRALQDELRDVKRTAADLESQIRELKFQLETLERARARLEDELARERDGLERSEQANRDAQRAHHEQLRVKDDDHGREVARLRAEIEDLKRQLSANDKSGQLAALQAASRQAESDLLDQLRAAQAASRQAESDLQDQLRAAQAEAEKQRRAAREECEQKDQLARDNEELRRQLQGLKDRLAKLAADAEDQDRLAAGDGSAKDGLISQLQADLREANADKDQLADEHARRLAQAEARARDLDARLQGEIDDLRAENDRLLAKIAELERALEAEHNKPAPAPVVQRVVVETPRPAPVRVRVPSPEPPRAPTPEPEPEPPLPAYEGSGNDKMVAAIGDKVGIDWRLVR